MYVLQHRAHMWVQALTPLMCLEELTLGADRPVQGFHHLAALPLLRRLTLEWVHRAEEGTHTATAADIGNLALLTCARF